MKKQVLLAVAALALSGAAAAQTYAVVAAGTSKHDLDCAGAATCDDSGTAVKLLGGYKFNPNFAIEGGYMSFGKSKAADPGLSLNLEVDGFGIGGAFHQDFATNWNFVARLGVARMKTKARATAANLTGSDSDSSTQLYGGLGLGYKLTKQLSVGVAYDFTKAEISGEKADVSAFTLGLTFDF
jgi:opacity protein-like surface antigen